MEGYKIQLLLLALGALLLLLALIKRTERQDPPIRIPPEFLKPGPAPEDPFRSPQVFARRMEDFGRFNTRYNETDGVLPVDELLRRSRK